MVYGAYIMNDLDYIKAAMKYYGIFFRDGKIDRSQFNKVLLNSFDEYLYSKNINPESIRKISGKITFEFHAESFCKVYAI